MAFIISALIILFAFYPYTGSRAVGEDLFRDIPDVRYNPLILQLRPLSIFNMGIPRIPTKDDNVTGESSARYEEAEASS
jgi:hypothetical protein